MAAAAGASTVKKRLSKTEKQHIIDNLFKPDEKGCSAWISVEDIQKSGLPWTKNGNCRHGRFFTDDRYLWEKDPKKGAVTRLRLVGANNAAFDSQKRPIRKDIRVHHMKWGCVVCGSKSDLVCDHKNDLYNDPRVLNLETQTLDDFQCLCNHCNLQKRQVAKETRASGKRYGATNIKQMAVFGIDFISGDETYDKDDPNAMVGTYWYDPLAFMKAVLKKKTT